MSKDLNLRKTIGTQLRSAREKSNMSRLELSKRIGKTDVSVYYWESGQTAITIDDLKKYCEIIGVDWVELLEKCK